MSNTHAFIQKLAPVTLQGNGITLVPLELGHESALEAAAADGRLWELRVTSVPEPGAALAYIQAALAGQQAGTMLPFAVIDEESGEIVGTTRYHDILPEVARVEIGYTWYAQRYQRTHVNTSAKLLLLGHAFDTLGAKVVGWRTDNFNFASQKAIERLGAHKDGTLRNHGLRRDGSMRDTVFYSLLAGEWPEVQKHLKYQLSRQRAGQPQYTRPSVNPC